MDVERMMRNMMQSMGMGFGSPFGVPDFGIGPGPNMRLNSNTMMPHGFMAPMPMMMMDPFQNMQQVMSMGNNGHDGGFSYCSSSVTSYTTDEQGRPQVYQQSREVKAGPGGVKETKSAVRDSRTGHQELSIGHHLRDKAHVKKKAKNVYTGEEEQAEDFVNIDEAESEVFEKTWTQQAKNFSSPSSYRQLQYDHGRSRDNRNRLALASSAREDLPYPTQRQSPHASSSDKSAMKSKKKKKTKEGKM